MEAASTEKIELIQITSYKGKADATRLINSMSGLLGVKDVQSMAGKVFYCATLGDKMVGLVGYRQVNRWLVEQVHTIVLPAYRGRGYGRLISDMMSDMLLETYGKVFCTVNENNEPMVRIKKSQGFELEGVLKDHYAKGRNIIVFSKRRK